MSRMREELGKPDAGAYWWNRTQQRARGYSDNPVAPLRSELDLASAAQKGAGVVADDTEQLEWICVGQASAERACAAVEAGRRCPRTLQVV